MSVNGVRGIHFLPRFADASYRVSIAASKHLREEKWPAEISHETARGDRAPRLQAACGPVHSESFRGRKRKSSVEKTVNCGV